MDEYPNSMTDPFISAGGQGQPLSTVGVNKAGSNMIILPQTMTFNSNAAQEFEIQLPSVRVDYVDVHITGTLTNEDWTAATALPAKYLTDYIYKLQITDNLKNLPVDLANAEIRAFLAVATPTDAPYATNMKLLNTLTPASGSVAIDCWLRLHGPFQLSAMPRPVLKIGMAMSAAATVALTVRASLMVSDIQTGEYALGYYFVTDSRSAEGYNRFAMGASMVQDIFVFAGAATAKTVTKVAAANVPANQAFTYDVPSEIALLGYAGQAAVAGNGITGSVLPSIVASDLGIPLALQHVDIAHNGNRELVVERTTTDTADTIVICRNQVIG